MLNISCQEDISFTIFTRSTCLSSSLLLKARVSYILSTEFALRFNTMLEVLI